LQKGRLENFSVDVAVIINNAGFLIFQGFLGLGHFTGGTLRLAVPAIILGFFLGVFIGMARLARSRWVYLLATLYVEFFRGVPLVMVIFWFWLVIPVLVGKSLPEYSVALAAFAIFEAAYFGEIIRAGIQSVPHGQAEAATATGLTPSQTMRYVILPQALRNMIPALVTQSIVLLKDTSLASIIGYVDLTKAAQIVNNREIRPFELYLFIAVIYWLCSYGMSRYAQRLERRLAVNPV
jgi:His/Glu/Gln/Arg/opine family amino acid ABC transporter permease subunit